MEHINTTKLLECIGIINPHPMLCFLVGKIHPQIDQTYVDAFYDKRFKPILMECTCIREQEMIIDLKPIILKHDIDKNTTFEDILRLEEIIIHQIKIIYLKEKRMKTIVRSYDEIKEKKIGLFI